MKKTRFVPPTPKEAQEYAASKGFKLDGEHFVAHYGSVGWKRGNTKITNWKLCVITWMKNSQHYQSNRTFRDKKPDLKLEFDRALGRIRDDAMLIPPENNGELERLLGVAKDKYRGILFIGGRDLIKEAREIMQFINVRRLNNAYFNTKVETPQHKTADI